MTKRAASRRHIVVNEREEIDGLDSAEHDDLRRFAASQPDEDGARPVLVERKGKLHARNYVGIIETRKGTVLEILPKVDVADPTSDEKTRNERNREVFYTMLRCYRGLRFARFNQAGIRELRRYSMLGVFVRLFLEDLLRLTKRGLGRHYELMEDNLPCLRGRIQFAGHIRHNVANGARFYCEFDEFTADRPENRLIHTTLRRLLTAGHPDQKGYRAGKGAAPPATVESRRNRQLLHELRVCFADVPQSSRPEVDWQRRRLDRSMRHYDAVMAWVGLFLFNHGLATYAGQHVNRALLFPMEEVFEDFLVDAFRRHQQCYRVRTQGPQKAFAKIDADDAFTMKPDIALMRGKDVSFVLDAKWKRIDNEKGIENWKPHKEIAQSDVYQCYSYGRRFGCRKVALLYPATPQFNTHRRYEFNDAVACQPLELWCFPFSVDKPRESIKKIMCDLQRSASSASG